MDTTSLRKVLDLEQKKGCADTAVIGGLDRFMRNWTEQASRLATDRTIHARIRKLAPAGAGYRAMTVPQRQDWIKGIITSLGSLDNPTAKGAKQQTSNDKPQAVRSEPDRTLRRGAGGDLPHATPPLKKSLSRTGYGRDKGGLEQPITVIKGTGTVLAEKLHKLGLRTVRDLLYFFPNRHVDYSRMKTISQLEDGKEETIIANVWEAREVWLGRRRSSEATLGDATGNVRAVWFSNPYLAKALKPNSRIVLSGRVSVFQGRPVFESPQWEPAEAEDLVHTGRLVPIYPLTEGLYQRVVRKILKSAVDQWAPAADDFLPQEIKVRRNLLDLPQAIAQAHYPDDEGLKDRARTRLAFDELFLLQLGVLSRKRTWQESQPGNPIKTDAGVLECFLKSLPFTLTAAQQRVLREILADMEKPQAMSRLLQGEVGSGKTVVGTAALLMAVTQGFQAALMAPTEILAGQHFNTIHRLLSGLASNGTARGSERAFPGSPPPLEKGDTGGFVAQEANLYRYSGILDRTITVAQLIGALPLKRKREIHKLILAGEVDIAIGTHALIQQEVEFKRLGFIIVDEQHRFGVAQRSTLRQKGSNPHVLVMTATPIPRTLALTLYGDLDLSVIDELPPGRQAIKTKWLAEAQRESAYRFIRREISAGHQAFIICPLIEESESVQARAAIAEYEQLSKEIFPDLKLGLLHGRMSAADKERMMQDFHDCRTHVLVSTPVVEVGIDVPNATVMMVESADRFGLSQLHQFRGRVGRGPAQSYCILLAENPSEVGTERLKIIETTFDGFKLAEQDLKLRGPGEFFGTRQSGLPDLKMARLGDVGILEMARKEAETLFGVDPRLKKPVHARLVKELARVWTTEAGEWS